MLGQELMSFGFGDFVTFSFDELDADIILQDGHTMNNEDGNNVSV